MRKIIVYSLILFSCVVSAQKKDKNLPKGNEQYADKEYAEAEANYRISHSKYKTKAAASYNLGNSVYKQGQPAEAKFPYLDAIKNAKTYQEKHSAYHNLGNVCMKEKNYSGAVEAYKNALRNNPNDEETRYNYALAKKFLKENPPKNDKNKDKEDKKDEKKNKDKQDEKKDGDKDKNEKDKGQDRQEPKDGDKDQPKPTPGGISKQRLESLLEAVNNEEKKVQEKVNSQKVKAPPKKTEKDW